ncbi:hypothetical protein C8R46DRAFT_1354424 [Mycena filopes]|nr:hypothetical protein C8R46DRAFT_1354424 [Mycena filopes]
MSIEEASVVVKFESPDGSKYAVASQEGAVAVWDVRSIKPLRVFQDARLHAHGRQHHSALGGPAGVTPPSSTFETEEILHMPAFPTPSPTPPLPPRQRPSAHTTIPPSAAYATSRMVRTLEDTFRIAAADNDDGLYIPPLGESTAMRRWRRLLLGTTCGRRSRRTVWCPRRRRRARRRKR